MLAAGRGHPRCSIAHPECELRGASGGHLSFASRRCGVDFRRGKLSRIIKEMRPDVVHAHDPHAVALSSLALSFMTGGKCPGLVASRRVAFHLKGHAFSRWKYHQVGRFVAASNAIREMLVGDGIAPDRVVTVYEGIDLQRVQVEPAANIHAEFWLPTLAPIVGAVAALTHEKGHRYLIDAAALVVRDVPDARFVIVGEGELRPALERRSRRHWRSTFSSGIRPDILLSQHFDLRHGSSSRGSHVAPRRDGAVESDGRERHRGIPRWYHRERACWFPRECQRARIAITTL